MNKSLFEYVVKVKNRSLFLTLKKQLTFLGAIMGGLILLGVGFKFFAQYGHVMFVILVLLTIMASFIGFGFVFMYVLYRVQFNAKAKSFFTKYSDTIVWVYLLNINVVENFVSKVDQFPNIRFVADNKTILDVEVRENTLIALEEIKGMLPKADFGFSIEKESKYLYS